MQRGSKERKIFFLVLLACLMAVPAWAAKHSNFITGPIESGSDVTRQCLTCHQEEAHDFMETVHWQWSLEQSIHGKKVQRGKANAINNFCTSVAGSEEFCAKCHAGYGMTDLNTFDFDDPARIDCLVCHDTTGTYQKDANSGGQPAEGLNLTRIAQNVGMPNRDNCGICHFFGGGGDAVKHGDLDSSLSYPDKNLDVHMDVEGLDFQCVSCHTTEKHQIAGHSLGLSPAGENKFGCESCHTAEPHAQSRLNVHTAKVACQTCHIPTYARQIPTKLSWDWSTAGQDLEGEHLDEYGMHSYVKKKGNFVYGKNVEPEYAWYNGKADVHLTGEKMNPDEVTALSRPWATKMDRDAKIYPFKVHYGKQIYDKENKIFLTAQVGGKDGYWKTFDWDKAARLGMEKNPYMREAGLTYSGEYGFAPTEMWWKLNHMVAPRDQALTCLECHGDNGRLDWKALGYKKDPINN